MTTIQRTLKNFFCDASGRLAVLQMPNLPLIGWFTFAVLARCTNEPMVKNGANFVSAAFLFTWAYLEITSGLSYFRRLLGLVILIFLVHSHFI